MKEYTAKFLIEDYKLGREFCGKLYVGVPDSRAVPGNIVYCNNEMMVIREDPVYSRSFPNKFGPGTYLLYYYKWEPEEVWSTKEGRRIKIWNQKKFGVQKKAVELKYEAQPDLFKPSGT